jgi:tetratricopeptide (TPR) repeat protein
MSGFVFRGLMTAVLLFAASPTALPANSQVANQEKTTSLKAGDVIVQRDPKGWATIKIIAVDTWPDGTETAHCIIYEVVSERPELGRMPSLPKKVMHAPIAAASFATGWQLLGNLPVVKDDQEGFVVYLKHTDFARYLSVTGQKVEDVVSEANRHYNQGITYAEAGDHRAAINAYDKAIDVFPLFFEAIDNKAFSYMDLGQYDVAIGIFEASLDLNPDGMAAFFSRGECFLRLGRLDEAAAVFKEGQERFPEERALFAEFAAKTQAARRQ